MPSLFFRNTDQYTSRCPCCANARAVKKRAPAGYPFIQAGASLIASTRSLGWIREQLIGLGGLPELLLDPLVGIDVGVQLLRQPTIGALDLVRRGGTA